MANNVINTRIQLKIDTLTNWQTNNPVLLDGEIAIAKIDIVDPANKHLQPAMIKVGDGTSTFNQLDWTSAKAADVYAWAKASTKPEYNFEELKNIPEFITPDKLENYYTKDEINTKLSSVYKFKGTQNPGYLNNINANIGDVYNMIDAGTILAEIKSYPVSVVEITDEFIYLEGEVPNAQALISTPDVTKSIEAPYLDGMATVQAKDNNIVRVFGIIGDTSMLTPQIGQTWELTFTSSSISVLEGDNVAKLAIGWDRLAGTFEINLSDYATKDELSEKANTADLATIATSGDIYDISNAGAVKTSVGADDTGEKYIVFNCGSSTTVI